jgi:uncharacterized membrane protein (UPF0182 family)
MELVIIIAAALVGFWLFFVVLKRVLRMALRLALVGALLLALLLGALGWWWFEPFGGSSKSDRNAPARPSRNSR